MKPWTLVLVTLPLSIGAAQARSSGANDTNSLQAADAAAVAAGVPLEITRSYDITSNITLSAEKIFRGGSFVVDPNVIVTENAPSIDAPPDAQIYSGAGTVVVTAAPDVWTSWWGALGNAATDFAPAYRAALGNNRTIHSYPASYVCGSTVNSTVYAPFPTCVNADGQINMKVDHVGSTFAATDAINAVPHALFFFARNTNLSLDGGTYVGDSSKLSSPSTQESAAIVTHNQRNPRVTNITASGNWGGLSTLFAMDFVASGYYGHIRAPLTGQCGDMAFIVDTTLDDWQCSGSDGTGLGGPSHPGSKGIAFIYDPPAIAQGGDFLAAPYNNITQNSRVAVLNSKITNYNSGIVLTSGDHFLLRRLESYGNPGNTSGAQGDGLDLTYDTNAVGHQLTDVVGENLNIHDNGAVSSGGGIVFGNGAITNGDVMKNFRLSGIVSNNGNQGVTATGTNSLTKVDLTGLILDPGTAQTYSIGGNLVRILYQSRSDTAAEQGAKNGRRPGRGVAIAPREGEHLHR